MYTDDEVTAEHRVRQFGGGAGLRRRARPRCGGQARHGHRPYPRELVRLGTRACPTWTARSGGRVSSSRSTARIARSSRDAGSR
ncbi:MAG: hypothetical protein MZU95_01230 [Desulfomicrobium escambiense]|nr:hypothetical protein [Desulfomicrobium escambiense]